MLHSLANYYYSNQPCLMINFASSLFYFHIFLPTWNFFFAAVLMNFYCKIELTSSSSLFFRAQGESLSMWRSCEGKKRLCGLFFSHIFLWLWLLFALSPDEKEKGKFYLWENEFSCGKLKFVWEKKFFKNFWNNFFFNLKSIFKFWGL